MMNSAGPNDAMVGRTISHYRIMSQLGAGGMGVVFRAEDVRLGREVAIKVVSEDYIHDEQALQRLRSEARAASALNHPNICTIYDIGEDEGRPFIVMELMKGATLRGRLGHGRLKVHQIVDLGIEIADALHSTHSDGIIHRDIKPGNIFLTDRGHVKLLDFGLAKLTLRQQASETDATLDRTAPGVALGTISYMSPEQATGELLDGRSDLFSLGVVLYECATGVHPFSGTSSTIILAGILSKAPVAPLDLNPDLPPRLQEVINNCLEKDRELRYQSAADLRADLKRLRRDLDSGATRTMEVVAGPRGVSTSRAVTPSDATVRTPSDKAAVPEAPVAAMKSKGPRAWMLAVAAAVVGLVAIGGYVLSRPAPPPATEAAPSNLLSDATAKSRLALATSSFEARNYRAAAVYAGEVLAVDPGNAEATRIRDESQSMLTRFDASIAEARQRLASGDIPGAARALEVSRQLDPTSPTVIELASRLGEATQQRQASAREPAATREPPRSSPAPTVRAPAAVTSTPAPLPPATQPPQPPEAPPAPTPAPPAAATPTETAKPTLPPPPAAGAPVVPPTTEPRPAPPTPEPRPAPAAPDPEPDEAAIRRLVQTYARAIESKDLGLFRSIKPNLSREEERRLQDGFRAVASQRVTVTITGIDRRGDEALVTMRRRDTIQAGGREQTAERQQTIRVARAGTTWVIVEIR